MRRAVVILALAAWPSSRLPAQTIDTIVVESQNVFGNGDHAPGFLAHLANALHVTTRPWVVRGTLLFDAGAPYDSARVAESARALRLLGVFRDVKVDTARVDGRFAVRVNTADGWSTKPQVSLSTAGGSTRWDLGLVEDNLLGTATTLAAVYRNTPDRSEFDLAYDSQHFLSRRTVIALSYRDLSDGRQGLWLLGRPFYQTSARWSLETAGEAADQRMLRFRNDSLADSVQRKALRVSVTGGYALRADSKDYARVWATAQWRREDFDSATAVPFPRSTTGAAGAGVELGHTRFIVLEHFNSYARHEDEDLSSLFRLGAWAAPAAWGYGSGHAGLGPEFAGRVGTVWANGFALVHGEGHAIFAPAGLDSGRVTAGLTVATQSLPRQAMILHVEAGATRRPTPGDEFDLWLNQDGPRLFGAHEFTGTRMAWVAFEDRVLVTDEAWGLVGVGVAPFVDWGGAWFGDRTDGPALLQSPRTGGDIGLALRLGPTRSVHGDVGEIAIGVRLGQGLTGTWAVAVRRGVAF